MSKNKESKNSPSSETSESEYRSSDESDLVFMELDFLLFNRHSTPNDEVNENESRDTRHDILENIPSTNLDEGVSGKSTIHETSDECRNEVCDSTGNIAANMEGVNEIPLRTVQYQTKQESIENTPHRSTLLEEINKTFASPTLKDVYECRLCKKKLANKSNLRRHMKIHSEEKPFKCDRCNYACKRKGHLRSHMKIHSNKRPFKCDRCNFTGKGKNDLSQHLNTHSAEKTFKCDRCDFTSKWERSLRRHFKTQHESKLEANQTKEKKIMKVFKCTNCSKMFTLQSAFDAHLETHEDHPNPKNSEPREK